MFDTGELAMLAEIVEIHIENSIRIGDYPVRNYLEILRKEKALLQKIKDILIPPEIRNA